MSSSESGQQSLKRKKNSHYYVDQIMAKVRKGLGMKRISLRMFRELYKPDIPMFRGMKQPGVPDTF